LPLSLPTAQPNNDVIFQLRRRGFRCDFPAAARLFAAGQDATCVFLLENGLAKLLTQVPDGRELITSFRGAGTLLGVGSAVLARPHAVSAIAVCGLGAVVIRADLFLSTCAEYPEVSKFVRRQQSEESLDQFDRLREIALLPARERVLALFRRIATVRRDRLHVAAVPAILYQDLAAAVGITPTHFSRVVKELEQEGVIERTTNSRFLVKTSAI
jgi:CRP-like cAMP-binding protein